MRSVVARSLINRNYAFLFTGQSISFLGDQVFMVALALWIATSLGRGQAWAAAAVSGVMIAWSAPIVLIGPVAGVYVDRWDKRRTMLATDALQAAIVLSVLPAVLLSTSVALRLAAVYTAVFLITVCSLFFLPSRSVLLRDVVPEDEQPRASALGQVATSLGIIVGPPAGAVLLTRFGFESTLLIDGVSFVASFLCVLVVRSPRSIAGPVEQAREGGFMRELGAGLRFFRGNRVLIVLLINGVLVMLGAGALNALDVFFVLGNLHASQAMYGVISGALGLGALLGAIALSGYARNIGLVRLFCWSLLGLGVALTVYSRLNAFAPALVVLFLGGVVMTGVNVAVMPLVLLVTPREMLGRVNSVLNPSMQVANIISVLVAGALVSTVMRGFRAGGFGMVFGPIDTVFTVAGLLCLAGGVYSTVALRDWSAPAAEPQPEAVASA